VVVVVRGVPDTHISVSTTRRDLVLELGLAALEFYKFELRLWLLWLVCVEPPINVHPQMHLDTLRDLLHIQLDCNNQLAWSLGCGTYCHYLSYQGVLQINHLVSCHYTTLEVFVSLILEADVKLVDARNHLRCILKHESLR
jgi:hypothetical protein